jgi:hypothetical protein
MYRAFVCIVLYTLYPSEKVVLNYKVFEIIRCIWAMHFVLFFSLRMPQKKFNLPWRSLLILISYGDYQVSKRAFPFKYRSIFSIIEKTFSVEGCAAFLGHVILLVMWHNNHQIVRGSIKIDTSVSIQIYKHNSILIMIYDVCAYKMPKIKFATRRHIVCGPISLHSVTFFVVKRVSPFEPHPIFWKSIVTR